ncbi:MAG: NAD(P)-binding domain-containing protein, partial [Proteobacteria bacterium]|nr:NAD(P)-binding domain-containing protein [Pseudomonadota bacterium]
MTEKIAFIGAGNMARSLVGGMLRHGAPATSIVAADPVVDQRTGMAALGITTTDVNAQAIDGAAIIVLAVKPQALRAVV